MEEKQDKTWAMSQFRARVSRWSRVCTSPAPFTNKTGHSRAFGVFPDCVTVVVLMSLLNPALFAVIVSTWL